MSIAQNVLDIAFGEMRKNASCRVNKIKISIGEFSGVVKDSLEFAFDVLKPDSFAETAEIEIEVVPMRIECSLCGPVECSISDLNLICQGCGDILKMTAGHDMRVDYLDLE